MLRRQFEHLIALGAVATVGGLVPGVGELAPDLPVPGSPTEVPTRIGMVDVDAIRSYTTTLRTVARTHGGQARAAVTLAEWTDQWLSADASDATRTALLSELAELQTIVAWCCHDGAAPARTQHHFSRSVQLAIDAGDSYRAAYALRHAGMMLVERSKPNNALKVLQLSDLLLKSTTPDNAQVPVVQAGCHVVSALALSRLDDSESVRAQARTQLAKAWDKWAPPSGYAAGEMDLNTGLTYLHLGQLDTAEAVLTTSTRTFHQSTDRREGVVADLALAQLYVQAGEPRGLALAKSAIDAVAQTRSGVARQIYLPPLVAALEARPGSDPQELARLARKIAT